MGARNLHDLSPYHGVQTEEPTSGEASDAPAMLPFFTGFQPQTPQFLPVFFPRTLRPKPFSALAPTDFGLGRHQFPKVTRIWVSQHRRIFLISAISSPGLPPTGRIIEKFKCPCHGSGYDPEGVNYEGPAPRPMDRARVELSPEGQIVVDTSVLFKWEKGKESQFDNPGAFVPV